MTRRTLGISSAVIGVVLGIAGCKDSPTGPPEARFGIGTGGSFVTTGGAEITLIVDGVTERWSFNAKGTPANGEFNFTGKMFGDHIHVHGDVLCYNVGGNRARVGGVITMSDVPGLVGSEAVWSVEDNGEGSNALVADRVTVLHIEPAQPYCAVPPIPDPETLPIETGNVQVHS